jgi:hypothetical protein
VPGDQIEKLVKDIFSASPEIAKKASALLR